MESSRHSLVKFVKIKLQIFISYTICEIFVSWKNHMYGGDYFMGKTPNKEI